MLASGRFWFTGRNPRCLRIRGWTGLNVPLKRPPNLVARRDCARSQRGEGHVKLLIVLVILAAIGYTGFKVVPAYVNNYQMQDTCESESRLFAARQKNEQKTRDAVWAQVQSLSIPVQQDAIKVEIIGRTARVSVDYTIPISLFGYDVNLDFHPKGESPVF
jgi:hypothetical protein